MTIPPDLTAAAEKGAETPLQDEVMFFVYSRQIGSDQWHVQESSRNEEDVIYWRDRNIARNSRDFESGAGRDYIAVKRVSTFTVL